MSRAWLYCVKGISAFAMVAGVLAARADAQTPAAPSPSPSDLVARGAYIVENVAQCGRCHTPVDRNGDRDKTRPLTGGALEMAPTVNHGNWAMTAPRIAGTPPGTDAQFITLMMTGISRTGQPPMRPMPQFKMTRADAEAVLAYLKSLPSR